LTHTHDSTADIGAVDVEVAEEEKVLNKKHHEKGVAYLYAPTVVI
jgi:hypothetical protein